jgi:ribosomal protein S18 acetylase RimI-like enzyme
MDTEHGQLAGHDTLVASWRALATRSPSAGVFVSRHWVRAVFPKWAPLNNVIAVDLPEGDVFQGALTALATAYGARHVSTWALWIPASSTGFDAPDSVELDGLQRDTTTLVMTADLDDRFADHDGVRLTSAACANLAGDAPIAAEELAPDDEVPGLRAWVMVQDGVAVAGLWAMVHGDDCGLYAVGTAPGWRRRGLARALVGHALADAVRRGARTSSLQSTPTGQQLYESLGFTAVGRYEEWLWS